MGGREAEHKHSTVIWASVVIMHSIRRSLPYLDPTGKNIQLKAVVVLCPRSIRKQHGMCLLQEKLRSPSLLFDPSIDYSLDSLITDDVPAPDDKRK